jgi:hypothetical protein
MNPEKRARYIERAALQAAQKAIGRKGGDKLTREELLALRIQAVEPWQRILLMLAGLIPGGLGILAVLRDHPFGGGVLILLGVVIAVAGMVGRRRTVEFCLNALGDAVSAPDLIAAIFDALN